MTKNATNSTYMKFSNRLLLLNLIRKKPISRAEAARTTGLTRAAITLIVDELLSGGILVEAGTMESDYGRKPILLDLNPECYYSIGLSVTRDGCYIGILNIKGELLKKQKVALDHLFNSDECLEVITKKMEKIIADSDIPNDRFLGIGVSAPGPVDINSGTILNPPNFNIWHNVNITGKLKESFKFNVFLDNNSASLTLAEKNYGRGTELENFMLLVVDTGIGAGIIINDNLYRGIGGFGSEVGHTSIDMNGKQCSCGNKGCLEVYASIPSILESAYENTHKTTHKNNQKDNKTLATWKEVIDKALEGDDICNKIIEKEAFYLSVGIVNAINVLELEAVILTGDINYKPELLLRKIRENVGKFAMTRHIQKIDILNSLISVNSEVIAAASIVLEKFFKGDIIIK